MSRLHFRPNVPVTVALENPQGLFYDFELQAGLYHTSDGQEVVLPRAAVLKLNLIEPEPGEQIQITQHVTPGQQQEWTVCLSPRLEQTRAAQEDPEDLTEKLQASIDQAATRLDVLIAYAVAVDAPEKPKGQEWRN